MELINPAIYRKQDDPPFSHVGLDFAGPIYFDLKEDEADNERSSKKSYMFVFLHALYILNSLAV